MTTELEQAKKKILEKCKQKFFQGEYVPSPEIELDWYGYENLDSEEDWTKYVIDLALQEGIKIGRKQCAEEIFADLDKEHLFGNSEDKATYWRIKQKYLGDKSV